MSFVPPKAEVLLCKFPGGREGDNRAEFTISESSSFFESEPVTFGKTYDDGTRWKARIPRTGTYYIYVVGHPIAHYTLKVRTK